MIFAEHGLSAEGWAVIIGAVFLGLGQLYTMYLNSRQNRAIVRKVEEKGEEVKELTVDATAKAEEAAVKAEETSVKAEQMLSDVFKQVQKTNRKE